MAINLNWNAPGPVSQAFADSDAFARVLMGPMNGGRRWTAVADIVRRPGRMAVTGQYQKHWRWLAAAPTVNMLLEKTMPAWHARVPKDLGEWDEKSRAHRVEYPIARIGTQIATAAVEIQFLALERAEDRRKLMQTPTTGIWLDHPRHMGEDIFADATDIAGLYPASLAEDALWCGIIMTTRMPAEDHWLARRADIAIFRQPGGRTATAESGHLPKGYYQRQAGRGKGDAWVRVNVDAEFGGSFADAEAAKAAGAEGKTVAEYLAERRKLYDAFPDLGPLRRELYPKHLEFFRAGHRHQERAFIAGNRGGKTFAVSYEAACHLTGWYPEWWEGKRFNRPITCWAAGEDAKAVREGLQATLMGPADKEGTGLIPLEAIGRAPTRGGIPDALDFVEVRHKSGDRSRLVFKAYEQKRKSFQSSKVDCVLLDEEPPYDIYTEALTRTMSTNPDEPSGIVMGSFTPLQGISQTVLHFLPGGAYPDTEDLRKVAWGW